MSFSHRGYLSRWLFEQLSPTEHTLIALVNPTVEPTAWPETDWKALDALVRQLGLAGRLSWQAGILSRVGVPGVWVERWMYAWRAQAARNLLLADEEARLLEALAAERIRAIAVKGESLGRIVQRDPTIRLVTDIDIAIRREDVASAAGVLEQLGYATSLPRGLMRHSNFLSTADEHTAEALYQREQAGLTLLVELHWNPLPLPEQIVWSSLSSYSTPGLPVRTLSPDLYLLYLCAHVSGHGRVGLRWLCDAADFLLGFGESIEGSRFLRSCGAAGLRLRVGVTFELIEAYFGLIWRPAEKLRDARTRRIAREFLFRPLVPGVASTLASTHRERLRLQDSYWNGLRYLWRLVHPTRIEYDSGRGSLRSNATAWLVRAARLAQLAWRERPQALYRQPGVGAQALAQTEEKL